MKRRKKQALTLLEIMIVIVLIGLIGSVIGVNMKGSLDQGKAFKSKQAKEQIRDILMLEVASGNSIDEVVADKEKYLANSGLVKNPKQFLKDGWGVPFEVKVDRHHENIIVNSSKLQAYEQKKRRQLGKTAEPTDNPIEDDED